MVVPILNSVTIFIASVTQHYFNNSQNNEHIESGSCVLQLAITNLPGRGKINYYSKISYLELYSSSPHFTLLLPSPSPHCKITSTISLNVYSYQVFYCNICHSVIAIRKPIKQTGYTYIYYLLLVTSPTLSFHSNSWWEIPQLSITSKKVLLPTSYS